MIFTPFFLITQHAVTVDRIITTARQIGIIISIRFFAGFIGALVFREIVENFVPEFVDLDVIQLELVKDLVGALLEMIGPPVVTPIVWVVGRVLEVGTPVVRVVGSVLEVITAIVRVVGRALEVGIAVVWVVG